MAHEVESFARYGVTLKNVRADWSGVSEDRKTVAVSLWAHLFEPLNDYAFDIFGVDDVALWEGRSGNLTRLKHLHHAFDHCDGIFRVVIATAKDPDQYVHERADYHPRPELLMRIGSRSDISDRGEFRAKLMRH